MSIKRVLAVGNSPIIASCIVRELNTCSADVVIVGEQQKKEQLPFGKSEPYIITRLPELDMPTITLKDISKGKKFYTDILNKRKRKKK